jgi:hypothetical protein
VPIVNDALADGDRTIHLQLDSPTGPATQLGPRTDAVLTITDDD